MATWFNSVGKRAGKEKRKIFGAALDQQAKEIPYILEACVVHLDAIGLEIEGLFRKSGSLMQLTQYKDKFNNGDSVDLSEIMDPHIVAGLLKMYIREYPEPLLTFELYDCFLATVAIPDLSQKIPKIKHVLEMLPEANLMIVKYLVSFLSRVSAKSELNLMTPSNLAIVFAPNLLRPPYEGQEGIGIMVEDTPYANQLLQLFINHYEALFTDTPRPASPKQKSQPTPMPTPTPTPPPKPTAKATRPLIASPPLSSSQRLHTSISHEFPPTSIEPPQPHPLTTSMPLPIPPSETPAPPPKPLSSSQRFPLRPSGEFTAINLDPQPSTTDSHPSLPNHQLSSATRKSIQELPSHSASMAASLPILPPRSQSDKSLSITDSQHISSPTHETLPVSPTMIPRSLPPPPTSPDLSHAHPEPPPKPRNSFRKTIDKSKSADFSNSGQNPTSLSTVVEESSDNHKPPRAPANVSENSLSPHKSAAIRNTVAGSASDPLEPLRNSTNFQPAAETNPFAQPAPPPKPTRSSIPSTPEPPSSSPSDSPRPLPRLPPDSPARMAHHTSTDFLPSPFSNSSEMNPIPPPKPVSYKLRPLPPPFKPAPLQHAAK